MHRVLSLWKEQGGKGIFITDDTDSEIKAIEIAINTLVDRKVGVIVPPSRYYELRRYFPNNIVRCDTVVSPELSTIDFFALFVIGADVMSSFTADAILRLKHKYIFVTAKAYDAIPDAIRNQVPRLNFISKTHVEYNYIVDMMPELQQQYDDIINRMKDLLAVFREYTNVTNCIAGDGRVSASAFRERFAADNGWSKDLNTDIMMFKQIDDYYNPDRLFDQATLYNTLIRERDKIISKSDDKVKHAVAIALGNKYKKIVILAKGDEVCDDIARRLRNEKVKAESIHATTPSRTLVDDNGDVILTKSGKTKGQPKVFGTKTVNDAILAQFGAGNVRVLVTTGTIDKTSKLVGVDIIICTSAKATNYYELKSRLSELSFNKDVVIVNIAFNIDKDIEVFKQKQRALNLSVTDAFKLSEVVL